VKREGHVSRCAVRAGRWVLGSERRILDTKVMPLEFMLIALRLYEGFPAGDIAARTDLQLDELAG
jgi:hypothetical protein